MQHLEGQVIWPADTASDGAGLTLTLTVQLRDVALQDIAASGAGTPAVPADDELSVEPWQIARLDDDPHRPANGQLEITLKEATS